MFFTSPSFLICKSTFCSLMSLPSPYHCLPSLPSVPSRENFSLISGVQNLISLRMLICFLKCLATSALSVPLSFSLPLLGLFALGSVCTVGNLPQRSGDPWMFVQIFKWMAAKLIGSSLWVGRSCQLVGLLLDERGSQRACGCGCGPPNVSVCRYFLCSNLVY